MFGKVKKQLFTLKEENETIKKENAQLIIELQKSQEYIAKLNQDLEDCRDRENYSNYLYDEFLSLASVLKSFPQKYDEKIKEVKYHIDDYKQNEAGFSKTKSDCQDIFIKTAQNKYQYKRQISCQSKKKSLI